MQDAFLTNKDASALIAADEAAFLRQLLDEVPAGDIVEIGAHSGDGSTRIFLERIRQTGQRLYSLDLFLSSDFKRKVEDLLAAANAVPVQGYSAEIGKTWNKELALLFVDGDHGYPRLLPNGHESGVAYDLLAWHPWLREGGVVALHDYTGDDNTFGHASYLPIEHAADGLLVEPWYRFRGKVGSLAAYEKLRSGLLCHTHRPKIAPPAYRDAWRRLDALCSSPQTLIVFGSGPAAARVRAGLQRSFFAPNILLADFDIHSGGVDIDGAPAVTAESLKNRNECVIVAGNVEEERRALEYFETQHMARNERYITFMDFLGWLHLGRYGYW